MRKPLKKDKLRKIIVCMLLMEIFLVSSVKAIGVGPTRIEMKIEKGEEVLETRNIQLLNSDTNPIHITGSVTGPIAQFITLEPNEFNLPAGPGAHSQEPRPYQYVKAVIRVPRELPENQYTGEILFTQSPVEGGVLGASAQIGVRVTLTIGEIAEAVFPVYINAMIVLLIILLVGSIFITYRRKRKKK